MVCDTKDALVKGNTTQRQVIFFLTMSSLSSKTKGEHMEFLDTFNAAPDILELFIALNRYWDHFNFGSSQYLAFRDILREKNVHSFK